MLNVNRKTLDKALAAVMLASVLITSTACNKGSQYTLNKIKLTETERTWKCPEDKYAELLGSYEGAECPGAMVVATDEDIVYLYCENALEKDGKTLTARGRKVIAKTPMRKFGSPSDLHGAARFLLSDEASFVTGVTLPVDGGFMCYSGV